MTERHHNDNSTIVCHSSYIKHFLPIGNSVQFCCIVIKLILQYLSELCEVITLTMGTCHKILVVMTARILGNNCPQFRKLLQCCITHYAL